MPPEEHDDGPEMRDSPLSPADDERIRRLLAEARHTEPIPPAVATRLDDALVAAVADRRERAAVESPARSASANWATGLNRSAGFFASARSSAATTDAGTAGRRFVIGAG